MILSAEVLANSIRRGNGRDFNCLSVIPEPDLTAMELSGEASITLRLGRWFVSMKHAGETHLDSKSYEDLDRAERTSKRHFVPFGKEFVIHPGRFVLGCTLEWLRLPPQYAGYVTGKSTWGRRGIIIETAAGVHPGFSGTLTLEIANVGEVPFALRPGMSICQLFVHSMNGGKRQTNTGFAGKRRPILGRLKEDPVLVQLSKPTPFARSKEAGPRGVTREANHTDERK